VQRAEVIATMALTYGALLLADNLRPLNPNPTTPGTTPHKTTLILSSGVSMMTRMDLKEDKEAPMELLEASVTTMEVVTKATKASLPACGATLEMIAPTMDQVNLNVIMIGTIPDLVDPGVMIAITTPWPAAVALAVSVAA